ncbi:MAG: hypothetical protein E7174_04230 [Firmicutes bacterium]|nr:hypothetical protein [Bacillota bacterium]
MNLKQKQTIINSIMINEIRENNLDTKFYSCCRINYYNSDFFKKIQKDKKNNRIVKLGNLIIPLISGGFHAEHNNERDIIVFLDKIDIVPGFSLPLVSLLKTTYHELYHALQNKELNSTPTDMSYDLFASQCDMFICSNESIDFLKYYFTRSGHDTQMFEILANLHGVKKTEEYSQNNNIKISFLEQMKLDKQKQKYQYQYQNYDLTKRLNLIIDNYDKYIKNDEFNKTIFELFLNENGTVKDINTIFSNENVLDMDPKILLAFIKTNAIKKAISETTLIEKTSYFLNELLTNGSTQLFQESENKKTI